MLKCIKRSKRRKTMPKINIMYEIEPDYLNDETPEKPDDKNKIVYEKGKNVEVSEKVFDLMMDEGLLRKTDNGYVFIGKYEDLHGKKKKKPQFQ
jgi:predicted transcriptional regulator